MDTGIRIFERFDPAKQRGIIKSCEVCKKDFGVFNREHQCKRCLRAICQDCGTTKRDVYKPKMAKRPHRLCSFCKKESDFLLQYIAVNQLKFGQDSEVAVKWNKKLPEDFRSDSSRLATQRQHRKLTFEIFSQLWDAYNFSLREFIGLMTFSANQADIYKLVNTVYEDMMKRGCQEKIEYLVFVIVFMLCFSSPSICGDLIEYLYNLQKSVTDNKLLLQLYLKGLSIQETEIKKLSEYFGYKLKQYMGCFSINVISTECTIHVISRIFQKKKIEEAHMLFALAIEKNCEFLITNRNNKIECDLRVIRTCDLEGFLQKYRILVAIKTASLVTQRSITAILHSRDKSDEDRKKSMDQTSRVEDLKFVANFKKKKDSVDYHEGSEDDSFSIKTKSIRESDDEEKDNMNPRKTKKNISVLMKSEWSDDRQKGQGDMKTKEKTSKSQMKGLTSECKECAHQQIKIEQLESKLKEKQRQISKMNLKLNFNAQGLDVRDTRGREDSFIIDSHPRLERLEAELREKREQNQNLFKQLNRHQKDNHALKSEIEELTMSNRMLRNRMETDNFSPHQLSRNTEREEEQARVNQLLEKKLMEKNRELEELIKKNRLLIFQVQEMENDRGEGARRSSGGPPQQRQVDIRAEELLDKMKELSERVTQEEEEKMAISQQLFQLRQKVKSLESEIARNQKTISAASLAPAQPPPPSGGKDCSLF